MRGWEAPLAMNLLMYLWLQAAQVPSPAARPAVAPTPVAGSDTILVLDLSSLPGIKRELPVALSEQLALQVRRQNP